MCNIDMNIRKDGKQLHHLSTRTLLRRIEESYVNKMKNIKNEILNTMCVRQQMSGVAIVVDLLV